MASDACIQAAGWKDFSFLGNRTVGESCRHGVAVLEYHGLYARGTARHSHSATKFQVRILGKTLSEEGVVWRAIPRTQIVRRSANRARMGQIRPSCSTAQTTAHFPTAAVPGGCRMAALSQIRPLRGGARERTVYLQRRKDWRSLPRI